MDVVVLAAGEGTRMGPLTSDRPKPLLPVAGQPLIDHVLTAAADVADRFLLVVGYHGAAITDYLGERFAGVPLEYVTQNEQRGTADALATAMPYIDGHALVLNGDVLLESSGITALAQAQPPAMLATTVNSPGEYGVLSVDDGMLVDITEKPESPASSLINAGAYLIPGNFDRRLQAVRESERGELEITDAMGASSGESRLTTVVTYEGFWQDVGYPWELLTASEWVLSSITDRRHGDIAASAYIDGPVIVESGATIHPNTVINGPAIVQAGAEVGPHAYLRDGVVIGEDAHIGHSVEVKRSVIMEGATAAHLSYLGDSVVGQRANLGAGTMTANLRHDTETVRVAYSSRRVDSGRRKLGAIIGPDVKTGINTSLNTGVVLDSGVTTMPGEVVLQSK